MPRRYIRNVSEMTKVMFKCTSGFCGILKSEPRSSLIEHGETRPENPAREIIAERPDEAKIYCRVSGAFAAPAMIIANAGGECISALGLQEGQTTEGVALLAGLWVQGARRCLGSFGRC